MGTSIAANEWNNRTVLHHVRLTEATAVDNPVFRHQIESSQSLLNIGDRSANALFDFTVNTQAAMMGLNDVFYVSAIIFVLIIPLIWITRPVKGGGKSDAPGAH